MDSTEVEEGAIIWKLYSHSFVVRTKSVTMAFDLIRPSQRFDVFHADTKAVIERIIEQCDALFISFACDVLERGFSSLSKNLQN